MANAKLKWVSTDQISTEHVLFLIIDHDNDRFTVEGPITDFLPWLREAENLRHSGRRVDFTIVPRSRARTIVLWGSNTGYEQWPPGTIIDPANCDSDRCS